MHNIICFVTLTGWGRGQEVPGEDPFLTGQYVMEYSYNMQYGEDAKYLKVVSTGKHYADYDQEGNCGVTRQGVVYLILIYKSIFQI